VTAIATFTICPESVEARSRFAGVATGVETGHSRARAITERPFRSWTLTWSAAKPETVTEIARQLDYTAAGALTLTWTPPGGSATEVRLASNGIRIAWRNAVTARVTVDLEEIR